MHPENKKAHPPQGQGGVEGRVRAAVGVAGPMAPIISPRAKNQPRSQPAADMFKAFSFEQGGGNLPKGAMPPPKLKNESDVPPLRKPSEQLDPFTGQSIGQPAGQPVGQPGVQPVGQVVSQHMAPTAGSGPTAASSDPGSTENSRNGSFFKRFPSISLISDFNEDIWRREGSLSKLAPGLGPASESEILDTMGSLGSFVGLPQRQRTPSIFFPPGSISLGGTAGVAQGAAGTPPAMGGKNAFGMGNPAGSIGGGHSIPPGPGAQPWSMAITPQGSLVSMGPPANVPSPLAETPQIPLVHWPEQTDTPRGGRGKKRQAEEMLEPMGQMNQMGQMGPMGQMGQMAPLGPIEPIGALETADDSLPLDPEPKPVVGATKVDQLMLLLSARKNGLVGDVKQSLDGTLIDNSLLPTTDLVGGVEKHHVKGNKHHECEFCHKLFTQSTHLEVHIRSHMGLKPYKCEFCSKRFTQGGNLRTHLRLHTGEKPFKCGECGKRFSRKGNLQAHELTHQNKRPFVCKFDNCNKEFTQLGNMKAHQNRFHLDTISRLTTRLATLDQAGLDALPPQETALLDYFASIYKNLNRGIKGRGRAKRVARNS